jgi:hypothetical protein
VPLSRRPAGSVLNLPFQGRLLPLRQRVSEWQAISVTQGEIPRDASYVHDAHIAEYGAVAVLCIQWVECCYGRAAVCY